MLNGAKDLSNIPLDWQRIVLDVLGMHKRIRFGVSILDHMLTEKEKLAIECCQTAIDKKTETKP